MPNTIPSNIWQLRRQRSLVGAKVIDPTLVMQRSRCRRCIRVFPKSNAVGRRPVVVPICASNERRRLRVVGDLFQLWVEV